MKILGRIIIILIAALAVAGAAIALVGNSSARFPDDRTESRPLVRDQPGGVETDPEGLRPPDRFH
jgi:hypothetical protein